MKRCEAWERVSWVNDGDEGIKKREGENTNPRFLWGRPLTPSPMPRSATH
jgi:hypothetical protein